MTLETGVSRICLRKRVAGDRLNRVLPRSPSQSPDWTALASTPLNYSAVGATAGELPSGYHHTHRHDRIGVGRPRFATAAAHLMRWDVHRDAGLRVQASAPVVGVNSVVVLRLGLLHAACRVIYLVDEPTRRGFAYGTLHGHPESGEEYFGVSIDPTTDIVSAEIIAFSRPATWWSRAGAPVAALAQRRITDRYLRAMTNC